MARLIIHIHELAESRRIFYDTFKVFFLVVLLLSFFLLNETPTALARTIWCNPGNVGSADGISKDSGYMTLHKALSVMSPGDEVIIADGDWRKAPSMFISYKHKPPDGTPENFSIVRAETDWDVRLPYIHIENTSEYRQGFLEFRGMVFDNRYIGSGKTHVCYHMHHTKFVRCGFLAHGLKGNNHTCGFGSADSSRAINQFNLMEECIAWGSGRYVFYNKYGKYNIFRRCVARHDKADAKQIFNFRSYSCDYAVYQNCISIDSDRIRNYENPVYPESGGFWAGDQSGATGNILDGCISIRDIQMAYYIGGGSIYRGSAIARNCVALDMTNNLPNMTTACAFVLAQGEDVVISNITGVGAKSKGHDGIYCKKSGEKHIENCILRDVNDEGIGINPSSHTVTSRNIIYFNVGGGKYGKESKHLDPFKSGLKYPVRVEVGSKLAKLGRNGTVCGATILRKIGVSDTLYGESGWNKVTDERLWPFPNETKIRELMRETVDGVSGKYGFCANGQTLSNYIWGYFGNTVPPFNFRGIHGDGKVSLKWDPPAAIAINSITAFKVYKLVGQTKTQIGGTVVGNTNCSKTISGLRNGSTYKFAVSAIDKVKGESGLSYTIQVTPEKPKKLSVGKKNPAMTVQKEQNIKKAKSTAERKFSNTFRMEFLLIRPGTFTMGVLPDEPDATPHQVTLTKPFYIQKTEVTQEQWKKIMNGNPSFFKKCGDNCPVEQVSWNEVQQFIKRLNQLEGTRKYRLPTEAEWEYACRAGTKTPFSFEKCLTTEQANYNGNYPFVGCQKGLYRKRPISVKRFPPNIWGLTGMHGNVWEWCQDWLGEYTKDTVTDPLGPRTGSLRVIRGGGWNSHANACHSGNRSASDPAKFFANLGFRLVREL